MQQTVGAFSRVESALTYFIHDLHDARRLQGGPRSTDDLRERHRRGATGRRGERDRASRLPPLRNWACRNLHLALPDGRTLLNADDLAFRRGERDAAHRPLRLRQVDPVPRHRRHLAVREGKVARARRRLDDAPAAAALHPDRDSARRRHLSGRGRSLSRMRRSPRRFGARSCRRSPTGSTRSGSGPRPCRSANSSASPSRARSWRSPTGCSSTRRRRRSTSRPRRRSTAHPREAAGHDDRLDRPPLDPACLPRPAHRHAKPDADGLFAPVGRARAGAGRSRPIRASRRAIGSPAGLEGALTATARSAARRSGS